MKIHPNINYAFSNLFVDILEHYQVENACICPGSRSSPIAISLFDNQNIKTWTHIDERGAGFFCTGITRITKNPVVVLSTSGTAASNFLPSIIESTYSQIPLVIVTADRPSELQGTGALQTIDQTNIFGIYPKISINLPTPRNKPQLLEIMYKKVFDAMHIITKAPQGVIHINFPFDDPLHPITIKKDQTSEINNLIKKLKKRLKNTRESQQKYSIQLNNTTKNILEKALTISTRGIIVCGPNNNSFSSDDIILFSEKTGFPILADPLSQVRTGNHNLTNIIDNHDLFLKNKTLAKSLTPDLIIRVGMTPTSKTLLQYLNDKKNATQIILNPFSFSDPNHSANFHIKENPNILLKMLQTQNNKPNKIWQKLWQDIQIQTLNTINKFFEKTDVISEPSTYIDLHKSLPQKTILYLSNSMPIRDTDMFFPKRQGIKIFGNRGSSGIDGMISSATGAATQTQSPVILLIGDIAFLHDLNSLLLCANTQPNLTIIILNNNGGGIFSFLPQSKFKKYFKNLFLTPHDLTFKDAADLFQIPYWAPTSRKIFIKNIQNFISKKGPKIIEITSTTSKNHLLHENVFKKIMETTYVSNLQ